MTKPDLKSTIIISNGTDKQRLIRVLLVDDETGFLNVSKKILEIQKTLQVDTASSIKEAYLKLKKKKFDIIVSDYQIPIKNGLQFLKELKEKDNNIPFILFTGKGREEVTIHALNLGANRYINKIGNPETVYGELTHAIIQEVEKHRSKQMLIESEEKYRVLVENAADGVAILQGKVFKFLNKRLAQILGFKQEELIGSEFVKLIPPENREWLIGRYKKRIAGDVVPAVYDIPALKKNGEKIRIEINTAFIQYEEKPASMAVIRDITERKKVEEILKESEERLRSVIESSQDIILVQDLEGKYLYYNAASQYGVKASEVVGKTPFDLHDQLTATKILKRLKQVSSSKKSIILENQLNWQGKKLWFSDQVYPIKDSTGQVTSVGTISRNITKQKKAEKFLEQISWLISEKPKHITSSGGIEEQSYGNLVNLNTSRLLVNSIGTENLENIVKDSLDLLDTSAAIYEKNGDYALGLFSSSWCKFLDQTSRNLCKTDDNKKALESGKWLCHESCWNDASKVSIETGKPVDIQCNGGINIYAVPIQTKDGVVGSINIGYGSPPKDYKKLQEIEDKYEVAMQDLLEQANLYNPRPQFLIELAKKRLQSSAKLIATIVEKTKAENKVNRALHELELLNEKLGIVGKLTRHDARNKLSIITNNIYLVKQRLSNDKVGLDYLEGIESAVDQAEKIFSFVDNFEKLGLEEMSYLNVGKSIEEAAFLLSGLGEINIVNKCNDLTVFADSLVRQLFYNLLHNSLMYGENVDQISVYYKKGKDNLKLIYEDNGVGIPEAIKEKIFAEGYGKGTGYGLFLIRKICKEYGWTIQETGKQGRGVQFTITIPNTNKSGQIGFRL